MASDNGSSFFTLRRTIGLVLLFAAMAALFLALKKPLPGADVQSPERLAVNGESFQHKVDQLAQAQAQGQTGAEVRFTGDEVAAALAQANAPQPADTTGAISPANGDSTTPTEGQAADAIQGAALHDPIVTFEDDVVRGQFATEVSGKTVYVTVAGHLGAKDGYATFDPTEFKLGDLSIPVSLINPALQKKLLDQRERMKLPDFVSDVRVEKGELVVKQK